MTKLNILQRYGAKNTLLVVEESGEIKKKHGAFFLKVFQNVYYVNDEKKCLNTYKKEKPSLVISALKLEKSNGLKLANKIIAIDPIAKIILLTEFDNKKYLFRALEIGIKSYLVKPISNEELSISMIKSMEERERDASFYKKHHLYKKLFEHNNVLTIFMKFRKIKLCNDSFKSFFAIETVEEFEERYKSIGHQFEKEKGFFYCSHNDDWIEAYTKRNKTQLIQMEDKIKKEKVNFILHVKKSSENHFIVTFVPLKDFSNINSLITSSEKSNAIDQKDENEKRFIIDILNDLKKNKTALRICNTYNGVLVTNEGTVESISEDIIIVNTVKSQCIAAQNEESFFIIYEPQNLNLFCYGELKTTKGTISAQQCEYAHSSPLKRKSPRLSPSKNTLFKLLHNDTTILENNVTITDLSVESIKIKTPNYSKLISPENSFMCHIHTLIGMDTLELHIRCTLFKKYEDDENYHIVFMLYPDKEDSKKIITYLSKRQMHIIKEFRNMIQGE